MFQVHISLPKAFYIIKIHKSVDRPGQLLYRPPLTVKYCYKASQTKAGLITHWLISCAFHGKVGRGGKFYFRHGACVPARLGVSPKCEKVAKTRGSPFCKKKKKRKGPSQPDQTRQHWPASQQINTCIISSYSTGFAANSEMICTNQG